MVTDCLAPVITPIGVATFVTANGMSCMGRGLKFNPIQSETYATAKESEYFRVVVRHSFRRSARPHRVFITADTVLLTPDGWQTVKYLHTNRFKHKSKTSESMVWGYKCHCVGCNKLYIPVRPLWSTCGHVCMKVSANENAILIRSLNATTVAQALVEDWIPLEDVTPVNVQDGVEAVRVNKIENGEDIYVNGILLSCKSLLKELL